MKSGNVRKQKMEILFRKGKMKTKVESLLIMTICAGIVFLVSFSTRLSVTEQGQWQVFAAAESDTEEELTIPSGFAGVISGISETPAPGSTVDRLGTSFGQIIVGQRVSTIEPTAAELDVSRSMENNLDALDSTVTTMAANPKLMSDTDYETLLRIVEAEAGSEDLKGRILVANVIMNRVKNEEFPDNVTDVVWERRSGVPQFSPTSDGTIGRVNITDETREAVRQVMEGVDYSQGALFFIQKDAASRHSIAWFDKDLKKLFKHGVHEFYTYPEETDSSGTEEPVTKEKEQ